MRVRPAVEADYAAAGAVCVAAYTISGQIAGDYARRLADVAGRVEDGEVLVAEDTTTGRILGSVTFLRPGARLAEISRPDEAEFRMLAVDPAAQGRGVGRRLTRACLDRAAELGFRAVVICTKSDNDVAIGMYQRLGFIRIPERDWSPIPDVTLIALRVALPAPDVREG